MGISQATKLVDDLLNVKLNCISVSDSGNKSFDIIFDQTDNILNISNEFSMSYLT